jgi:hypothetical protein
LQFDQAIVRIVPTEHAPHLTVGVQQAAQGATISLARDPFVLPSPWRVVLLVDFAHPPHTGQMIVGALQHDFTAQLAAASQATVVVGRRCDELLGHISPASDWPVESQDRTRSERYSTW